MAGLDLITAPSGAVISIAEAKANCRVTHDAEDASFAAWALAADGRFEDITGRQALTAQWRRTLDRWPACGEIQVPLPPLQSVESITYLDTSGDWQTLDTNDYVVETFSGPRAGFGRISLAYGKSWPSTLDQAGSIRIDFTAGYGDPEDVPGPVRQGLLLFIGSCYVNREDEVSVQVRRATVASKQLWMPYYVR